MPVAEVGVAPSLFPGAYVVVCSVHGRLTNVWADRLFATFDAIGHAAAHHART